MKPVDSGPCSWDLASQQLEILPLVRTKACILGIFIGIQKPSPLNNRSPLQEKSMQRSNRIAAMVFEVITNVGIVAFFFLDLYFLMQRWRSKVRISVSISLPGAEEIMAVVALLASFSYVLGFFGIHFTVKSAADFDHRKPQKNPESNWVPISNSVPNSKSRPSKEFVKEEFQEDSDEELAAAVVAGDLASYSLESKLQDCSRAVSVRRRAVEIVSGRDLEGLGFEGFDYSTILGQCCEMPIGFVRIPVGVAGPLLVDGSKYFVPMATTEGCLVASTNRGCKAITLSGGASSVILDDGMTRAPVVRFQTAKRAAELKFYMQDPKNFEHLSSVFNSTSRFARLQSIKCALAGRNLYLRVKCSTGDAMGMNMVSKGAQLMLEFLNGVFPDMEVLSISGNFCADKKPTAINWIEGRGKWVSCEAVIKKEIVESVLKTSVNSLIELNMVKNLAGSAVAGAVGGNNAHAANIVSALFIATGQDPAQNVESSQCITMAESTCSGDLHFSVTMPCIEVGTVGGGTHLSSQAACLNLLGVRGANADVPGLNAQQLAKIVAGAVLAGELSLLAALSVGHLVKSHMKYNRSSKNISSINAAMQ